MAASSQNSGSDVACSGEQAARDTWGSAGTAEACNWAFSSGGSAVQMGRSMAKSCGKSHA
eukprot:CAMPEP_0171103582 /NCGR_PEP_ID=MMETSP0766_2-20121228/58999_1 /TAXON_ID=439317 /ORGANISM="Gambierdiscus australes, Strain CAWD 149" /LENGTH=59 /DNA_ID=CAMNT_0011564023 /DNA_START=92 /DNA_END=267 /DNA_ORIENTATION=-